MVKEESGCGFRALVICVLWFEVKGGFFFGLRVWEVWGLVGICRAWGLGLRTLFPNSLLTA